MNEMIERVARAIFRADGANPDSIMTDGDALELGAPERLIGKPMWQFYADHARAAIEAMREPAIPVEYMLDRWINAKPLAGMGKKLWGELIDAALKE